MKKAIILLFSLSLLVFATPENDVNNQPSYDLVKTTIQPAQADPIYPPVG
jgi:hypothetical protein